MSVKYYNQNARAFFDSTKDVEMSSLTDLYLPFIPAGGHILDAGCGSGRDSKYFKAMGYKVTAFDASEALATIAAEHIGQEVFVCGFQDFDSTKTFDGIWACASLLHVPAAEMAATFTHLAGMLRSGGAFYCSFKYGSEDSNREGRSFTNCDEDRLALFIENAHLQTRNQWVTTDLRPGRENERWLNAILVKE